MLCTDAFDEVLTAAPVEQRASNWLKARDPIVGVKDILEEVIKLQLLSEVD